MRLIDLVGAGGRMRIQLGALSLGVVAVLALAFGQAAVAGTWAPRSVPLMASANGQLSAVTCQGSTSCIAVGYYTGLGGRQRVFSQTWNGSAWTRQSTPDPAGAIQSELHSVSCTSASACTAVGTYDVTPGGQLPLAERWNGSSWTVQTVSIPSGATFGHLGGVACQSASSCFAVGSSATAPGKSSTLTERWNGSTWAIKTTPNPSGATASQLNGVSCSGTICYAAGDAASSSSSTGFPNTPFAERWNGTAWTLETVPSPAGTTAAMLNGVSCTSTTACTAVGGYATSSSSNDYFPNTPLAERWNGTKWTLQATPANASTSPTGFFGAVSCASATSCTAVGSYSLVDANHTPVLEHWNGSQWAAQTASSPMRWNSLYGISCTSAGCTSVGSSSLYGQSSGLVTPLVETQAAGSTTWTQRTAPGMSGGANGALLGTSCLAGAPCLAVGWFDTATGGGLFVVRQSGTNWVQQMVVPSSGGTLRGVSCPTASVCTTVGETRDRSATGTPTPLAERWNGSSWTTESVPMPSGSTNPSLFSVACPTTTSCVAVGTVYGSNGGRPLIEQWNGSTWNIASFSAPAAAYSTLSHVACSGAGACTAVGYYLANSNGSQGRPLVERLTGSTWTQQTVPLPSGTQFAAFTGVSCTAPKPCTTVGNYSTTSPYYGNQNLAERWNGTSWTIQSPHPGGGFLGVSCPTLTACQALTDSSSQAWDGTSWSFAGSLPGSGADISCTSASACVAVGEFFTYTQAIGTVFAGLIVANRQAFPQAESYSSSGSAAAAPAAIGSQTPSRTVVARQPDAPPGVRATGWGSPPVTGSTP
jgi:hypothetical protein